MKFHRDIENVGKKLSTLPITDMDSEHIAQPSCAEVGSMQLSDPPSRHLQSTEVCSEDPFYDSVPREENISYIDGLLDLSTFST